MARVATPISRIRNLRLQEVRLPSLSSGSQHLTLSTLQLPASAPASANWIGGLGTLVQQHGGLELIWVPGDGGVVPLCAACEERSPLM